MAFCTYCGQQFQRNEHLERHLVTHTNIKRFKCSICHISFSRGDVLQKHITIHQDVDADSPQGVVRVRARTQTACRNCAKMKAKCDSNSPCNRCRTKQLSCDRQSKRARAAAVASQPQRGRGGRDRSSSEITDSRDNEARNGTVTSDQPIGNGDHPETEIQLAADPSPPPQKELGLFIDNTFMNSADAISGQGSLITPEAGLVPNVPSLAGWPVAEDCQRIDTTNIGLYSPGNPAGSAAAGNQDFPHGQGDSSNADLQTSPQTGHGTPWDSAIQSMAESLEHPSVLEGRDYWSSFRCNPKKDTINCPRTAGIFLENLSQMPRYDRLWSWFDLDFSAPAFADKIISMPLLENTRDTLSAISQSFLQKALEVHKLDPAAASVDASSPGSDVSRGFLVLPPAATLEYFLGEYMRLFEPFYRVVPGGVLDANLLLSAGNSRAGTLLILLMIAQAASSDPTSEGRRLSAGLTEVCRISLFDLIEKDVSTCHHPFPVHSALLFITQASWSGDKWLMDIGLGQRGIYIAMVRHGGLFDVRDNYPESDGDWELSRTQWLERERIVSNRLAYAWVLLDLEISLFQDANLHIPVLALNSSLPSNEQFWLARDATTWQQLLTRDDDSGVGSYSTQPLPQPSLRTLFQWFLNDDLTPAKRQYLSPLALRLLLHPLHALVYSCRQLLDCLGETSCSRSFSPITKASTHVRMHEIRSLLQRWLDLYKSSLLAPWSAPTASSSDPNDVLITATLITFHVINLNTVASIPDIEELARRDLSDREIRHFSQEAAYFVHSPKEAVFHAGRILQLLGVLDRKTRPPWWPAALYRATLALWACSVFYGALWTSPSTSYLLIDEQEGDSLDPYSWNLVRGTNKDDMVGSSWDSRSPALIPALKNSTGAGGPVTLGHPTQVLETCLLVFDTGVATRVSEGIRGKLSQLLSRRNALSDK
ncbi:hypothetical protein F5Y05DRAFT_73365 [Hypoxylon sp. FL0543]|nr:hypothetical protein F5Y05DRAFT_73365 [Hypoxylon sp. FL0543]